MENKKGRGGERNLGVSLTRFLKQNILLHTIKSGIESGLYFKNLEFLAGLYSSEDSI